MRKCATQGCRNNASPGEKLCLSREVASWVKEEAIIKIDEPEKSSGSKTEPEK